MADLISMQRLVQRDWTPDSHWHVGDLAWQRPSMADRRIEVWPSGWAWIDGPAHLDLHAPPGLLGEVLAWFDELAPAEGRTVTAMETDNAILDALTGAGYRPVGGPYFRHCLRALDSLPEPRLPDGYRVRPVRPAEIAERAAVHRAAWRPRRIGELQVPPVDLGSGESGMTAERYRMVSEAWPYRRDLDLVVEGPDGTLVASALGWYDDVNRCALLEPVGTDPAHGRRGLGAAVSLACLHAMRAAGATLALVCPRGDEAYPVPLRLYQSIGFRCGARTVTWAL